MPKTARKTCATELICPEYGNISTIQRIITRQKEFMHIKDLYCPICQEVTKQIEIHDRRIVITLLESMGYLNEKEEFLLDLLMSVNTENEEKQSDEMESGHTLSKKIWKPRNF